MIFDRYLPLDLKNATSCDKLKSIYLQRKQSKLQFHGGSSNFQWGEHPTMVKKLFHVTSFFDLWTLSQLQSENIIICIEIVTPYVMLSTASDSQTLSVYRLVLLHEMDSVITGHVATRLLSRVLSIISQNVQFSQLLKQFTFCFSYGFPHQ